MEPVLSASQISKSFGKYSIIEDLSLSIDQKIVYGLVGLNGAGKTTLIRLLLGILKIDNGGISVLGHDPWKHEDAFYKQIGVVMENDGFLGNLTIRDNLKIFAAAKSISWAETESYLNEYWRETFILSSSKKVKFLSRGQRMQCGLCRAFLGWPKVCLFDEPLVALDVEAYEHFKKMVIIARDKGSAVLISSHQLEAIDDLCDRVGILRDKQVHELDHLTRIAGTYWIIESDSSERCKEQLIRVGAKNIEVHLESVSFTIDNENDAIPEVVKSLVMADIRINQVRKEDSEFSTAIRRLYKKNQQGTSN